MESHESESGTGGGLRYLTEEASQEMVNQERSHSCQAACARQLLRDVGIEISEQQLLVEIGYHEAHGTTTEETALALSALHPNWMFDGGSITMQSMATLLRRGSWIANVRTDKGTIHAVIVDRLEGDIIQVRDPWGLARPGSGMGTKASLKYDEFLDHWHWALNKAVFPSRRK